MDNDSKKQEVAFSVDAGIINRLGKELVAKEVTAVSELVKNSYDADAREVTLVFEDAKQEGGKLTIEDDGHGMTDSQLISGFLKIASPDKIKNPRSPLYNRKRAGRKGIGRFATQRLGEKLIIKTQTNDSDNAWKLTVDWNAYQIDSDISEIKNIIEPIPRFKKKPGSGTIIIIEKLRDKWTDARMKRVFRYVSDLLQPDFLSEVGKSNNLAKSVKKENYFNVNCYESVDGSLTVVANTENIVFDSSIAEFRGIVAGGQAICEVESKIFGIKNQVIDIEGDFSELDDVYFKAYYYIFGLEAYKRYYRGRVTKAEYNKIEAYSQDNGGIRVYRNGFRVLPYGAPGNDWLSIDKKNLKSIDLAYVPFSNRSLLGFVEINDPHESNFTETASREGLIENKAFEQLKEFTLKALISAAKRVNSFRLKKKKEEALKDANKSSPPPATPTEQRLDKMIERKEEKASSDPENVEIREEVSLLRTLKYKLEEADMLRILAGVGLTVAEFTHEIRQFIPKFQGGIGNLLQNKKLSKKEIESIKSINDSFSRFESYVSYIDETVQQNVTRERTPLHIGKVVNNFIKIVEQDAAESNIRIESDIYGHDLITLPMHPSEWHSILYNLYTNSKKAIKRSGKDTGHIRIICDDREDDIFLTIEFMDNGDGIAEENKDQIFNPFFTTSPANTSSKKSAVVGTGLGLKIVHDIIVDEYKGEIKLVDPEDDFSTCFFIKLPKNNES